MPSIIDDNLNQIYNRLPEEIDKELREVVRTNTELDTLLSINYHRMVNPNQISKNYNRIIIILTEYEFSIEWIREIFREYLNGEKWSEWENIEKIASDAKKAEEAHKEDVSQNQKNHAPTEFSFSVNSYKVTEEGVFKIVKADGIEYETPITPTPFYISAVVENIDEDESLEYKIHIKNIMGKEIDVFKKPGELLKRNEVLKLQDVIHFKESVSREIMDYFDESILKYRNEYPIELTAAKNGWKSNGSQYVIGDKIYSADGKRDLVNINEEVAKKYEVAGDKKEWIENLKEIIDEDLVRLKMYAAVGAMIIRFTPVDTFILHNYAESSGGKTTGMMVASSIVGNPSKDDGLITSANNSNTGFELHLEHYSDTPIFFDETSANQEFVNNIYMIGNERGKGRGTKELNYREGGSWKTIVQTSGEDPLTSGMSTKTGNQTRVVEIHERLNWYTKEFLDQVYTTIKNNHGLFLDEIMQEIFINKDRFGEIYKGIAKQFDDCQNEFAGRKKGYFVVLAMGGNILEKVFIRNGIDCKNNIEICKKYYAKAVIEDPTIPYADRALQCVYQWTIRNMARFERPKDVYGTDGLAKGAWETFGWITAESIYFDPGVLENQLEKEGFNYERVIEEWKKEIITYYTTKKGTKKSFKSHTTINGKQITGIRIKIHTLMEKLGMEGSMIEVPRNEMEKEPDEMNLREKCMKFLEENCEYKNVTYTDEQAAEALIQERDQIELLYGKKYIVDMMEVCRRGCRSE